jgi:hypothetical protein
MCFWKAYYQTNSKNFTLKHASVVDYRKLKAARWTSEKYSCINICFSCDRDICSKMAMVGICFSIFLKSNLADGKRMIGELPELKSDTGAISWGKPCTVLYYNNLIILATMRYCSKLLPESPFLKYTDIFFIYCYYMLSNVEFVLCIVACCLVHM